MYTSADLPLHPGAPASPGGDVFAAWDDVHDQPRVSHRTALAFIIGASFGCYALIYAFGTLAQRLLAGA